MQCENEALPTEVNNPKTYFETIDPAIALNEILTSSLGQKKEPSVFKEINLDKEAKKMVYESGEVSYTFALVNDGILEKTDNFVYTVDNLAVQLNDDGSYTSYIFRYTPDMTWFNDPNNDFDSYSGEVELLDADWQSVSIFTLINGEAIQDVPLKSDTISGKSSACDIKVVEICTAVVQGGESTGFICELTLDVTCIGGGDDLPDGGDPSNPDDGDDDTNSSGGNGKTINTDPILGSCIETNTCEEEQVDTSQLDGKAKCVYDKLEENNSDLFIDTIAKFIDDPDYDLTFIVGNCSNTDIACTNGDNIDTTGEIIIILEDIGQPVLELAATILHEGIHAEIFRYVHRFENNVDPNNRARLLQLYNYYKGQISTYPNESYAISDAQHVYMAENYVKPIAEAIRSLDSNNYPLEHYMWYGWEGLDEFDFQDKLTDELEIAYNNFQTTVNENTDVNCD